MSSMKKLISLILVLAVCLSLCCTAFATEFVESPTQGGNISCDHGNIGTVNQKDADCTHEGYTGDVVCSDCGEVLVEGEVIPTTEHQYDENGICTVCGQEKETPATGDASMLGLWIGMMLFAAVALVVVVVVYRKKFANQ